MNEIELENKNQQDQPDDINVKNKPLESESDQISQNTSQISSSQQKRSKLMDMFLLRDEKGKKSINRVCCFKINKHWTIKTQMIVSLLILSISVFILVIAIVLGNLILTRELIKKSSEDAIQQQIKENLHNSAKEYSNAILEIFNGYSSTLEILSRIILSALKRDDKLFDFNYVKEFPVEGQKLYFSVKDQVPLSLLSDSEAAHSDFAGIDISYKSWQWGAFGSSNTLTVSPDGQKILDACDILNYFLEDFFFDKNVTHIQYIYFAFETDKIAVFYPGGTAYGMSSQNYDPTTREWYNSTKQLFYTTQPPFNTEMIITGPYYDSMTNIKTLTISKAIIDKDNIFVGVAAIDMLVSDLQNILDRVKFYDTGFLMQVSEKDGVVLNEPYKVNQIYYFYDQSITGFDRNQWESIRSRSTNEADIITLENLKGQNILLMRNFITTNVPDHDYILIVQVPESEAYHFLYELTSMMEDTFLRIEYITLFTICLTCIIAIVSGYIYSNKIVQPLTQLTEYAQNINNNATKKSLTQNIDINLDNIKATDKIGELIEAFKNLVKGLSGLKKGARTEMAAGNEKINFPINFYCGTKMKWHPLLKQLKNYEKQNQASPMEESSVLKNRMKKQSEININF